MRQGMGAFIHFIKINENFKHLRKASAFLWIKLVKRIKNYNSALFLR